MKTKPFEEIIKRTFPGILSAWTIGFLILLYAPLEQYVTNIDGFTYDFYDLIRVMLPLFLIYAAVSAGIMFLSGKLFPETAGWFSAVCIAVFAALYIQGTFFSGNLPPLDGRVVDWTQYDNQRICSVLIWILAAAGAFAAGKFISRDRLLRGTRILSVLILITLFLSAVLFTVTGEGFRDKHDLLVTDDKMLEMSDSEDNLVILVLDCIGGNDFYEITENNPEYAGQLKDFTFFRNTVGAYPFTQYSVPYILSGEWYENGESFYSYKERVYCEAPLLTELRNRKYNIGLYEQDLPTSEKAVGYAENAAVSDAKHFNNIKGFITTQLKLSGLKYFPYDLKRFCIVAPDFLYANSLKKYDVENTFDWSNMAFYQTVKNGEITPSDEKCFRFIHISGAHDPFLYDKNMNITEDAGYVSCIEGSIKCVSEYLDLLKASGCYENTAIIVMADHGYFEDTRQNPLLLIKGIGESHPYRISEAPISYEDLQQAYVRLMDGEKSENLFDWREGDARERRYLEYIFYSEDHMKEYLQRGYATDPETFQPTGNEYIREGTYITSHSFFDW